MKSDMKDKFETQCAPENVVDAYFIELTELQLATVGGGSGVVIIS